MKWFEKTKESLWLSMAVIVIMGNSAHADFVYSEPIKVPNINLSDYDGQVHVSPDGLELYLVSRRDDPMCSDLYVSERSSPKEAWSTPVSLGLSFGASIGAPCISADGLELYFGDPGLWSLKWCESRPGGYGDGDLWVATRATRDEPWGEPQNLGPIINSESFQADPSLSADGLTLYFTSRQPGEGWQTDIYVTTRNSKNDPWRPAEKLEGPVNSSDFEGCPHISADNLTFFFQRGFSADIYVSRRATPADPWGQPVPFEPANTDLVEFHPTFSEKDSSIYFARGGEEPLVLTLAFDIWQVEVTPVLDLNRDGAVDELDIDELLGHWDNTDNSLYDIAPIPLGDGVADAKDLSVLNKHLYAKQKATNPYPTNMTNNIPNRTMLTWESNEFTQSQDVYLGTDYYDVSNATPNDSSYMGRQEANSYDPGELDVHTTYYWRVDHVNTYKWRIDEKHEVESTLACEGSVWQFTTGGIIADHYPEDRSSGVDGWPAILSWVSGTSIIWCDLYLGVDRDAVVQATTDNTDIYHGRQSADETSFTTDYLNPQTTYYWRIDGVDSDNPQTISPGKVRQFTTANIIAGQYPANNATLIDRSVILSWEPGGPGLSYDVYFGPDRSSVAQATPASAGIYQGQQTSNQTTFSPGTLKAGTSYFWRIDSAEEDNPDNQWKGPVWTFTTKAGR